jgi:MSHA biogenesis protein MshQ
MNAATTGSCAPSNCDARQIGAATQVRFGRLGFANAYGSELLNIRVPVTAQYLSSFVGATPIFTTNALDNCTSIPASALVLGNYKAGLNGTNMGGSHLPGSSTVLSGGTATLTVTKPSPAAVGSVDLAINLGATGFDANCIGAGMTAAGANLPWLRGNWCGGAGFIKDPNARLNFGTSRSPFIFLREMY